jgi:hypothetical protein
MNILLYGCYPFASYGGTPSVVVLVVVVVVIRHSDAMNVPGRLRQVYCRYKQGMIHYSYLVLLINQ